MDFASVDFLILGKLTIDRFACIFCSKKYES